MPTFEMKNLRRHFITISFAEVFLISKDHNWISSGNINIHLILVNFSRGSLFSSIPCDPTFSTGMNKQDILREQIFLIHFHLHNWLRTNIGSIFWNTAENKYVGVNCSGLTNMKLKSIFYEGHTISFQTFFVWALLLMVHTGNSISLRSNLLRLQCTCTVLTTSGRPHRSPLV